MVNDAKAESKTPSGLVSSPPIMMAAGSSGGGIHSRTVGTAIQSQSSPKSAAASPPSLPPPSAVSRDSTKIFDDAAVTAGYESVPLIKIDTLPRGGISFETKGVGRVQFGIPPETIKDSMVLGMEVPTVYIVPVERFCRELGHALGLNFAEFEFPAYFNFFVKRKRVQLVVDSIDAEQDIRTVFGETLLGPAIFRNLQHPCENVNEDFDPTFPTEARPNFYKEFLNFRTAEDSSSELSTDTLLEFIHFQRDRHACRSNRQGRPKLGVPPRPPDQTKTKSTLVDSLNTTKNDGSDADSKQMPQPRSHLWRNSTLDGQKFLSVTTDDIGVGTSERDPVRGVRRNLSDDGKLINKSSHSRKESGSLGSLLLPTDSFGEARSNVSVGEVPASALNASVPSLLDKSLVVPAGRRDSAVSFDSDLSGDQGARESRYARASRLSAGSSIFADFNYNYDFLDDDNDLQDSHWMYSQAKWLGEVATVYPPDVTEEQKRTNSTARVEIFKMAGGTEYIVHDVDESNIIIGKARFSGTLRVPDERAVRELICSEESSTRDRWGQKSQECVSLGIESVQVAQPPVKDSIKTFHPPSFGVTVLGNSHGFDKNGNTSGYVLWVNGRGIMIDPPPYSSSALEMEGIRPQTIIAIIITHCHADHDAGAFQKIMTGARVAIITTPTIYKSFIRKYSALSGLSSSLLRHSHRFRPAIIGQPLKMQGAVFHFTYTLHTIPCISFKVEWRGRSIVFTGDHMNIPEQIQVLEEKGTLSKKRADDLRQLPLQECDILLHEAGSPPIHTPLKVLQDLPKKVRDRLYIVHTAAIPSDCGLRVAPTGTAGTLRLDNAWVGGGKTMKVETSIPITVESLQDGAGASLTVLGDFNLVTTNVLKEFSEVNGSVEVPPLVFKRPTDVSDAWFILNLLSAVPFLASLSYAHTMEVLEIANVELFCAGQVVLQGVRRPDFLCVFWEGACRECVPAGNADVLDAGTLNYPPTVWHAGDWTCPLSLQPDPERCVRIVPGERHPRDIVAVSKEGVKVILLSMKDLQRILKSGSKYYRKYLSIEERQRNCTNDSPSYGNSLDQSHDRVIEVIQFNSVLGTLYPKQKRHLESLAEGPRHFPYQSLLWKVGEPVDFAYIIVAGTATLGAKTTRAPATRMNRRGSTGAICHSLLCIDEQEQDREQFSPITPVEADKLLQNVQLNSEYSRLETVLHLRMEEVEDEYLMSRTPVDPTGAQRDKFANKVLARLNSRRAYTEHLVFSRGNFLCDTSRMVSGDLANTNAMASRTSLGSVAPGDHYHTTNMIAGHDGCLVYIFPRTSLVPFLDSNPGVLLSLLGSQVVV